MHKRLSLGYTTAKTEDLKKFHFAFAAEKGVIHEGLIHEACKPAAQSCRTIGKQTENNSMISFHKMTTNDFPKNAHGIP